MKIEADDRCEGAVAFPSRYRKGDGQGSDLVFEENLFFAGAREEREGKIVSRTAAKR